MNEDSKFFRIDLSTEQVKLLQQIASHGNSLRDFEISDKSIFAQRQKIEELRARLTEMLMVVGFDSEYALTEKGERIEDLIDALFVP